MAAELVNTLAAGIDLGGTFVKYVLADSNGQMRFHKQVVFDPAIKLDWFRVIESLVAESRALALCQELRIGVSAPGLAAKDARSIAFMPGRLEGLEGLDWTVRLHATSPIPVLNDAQAALLGECWVGAARKCQNVVMLTLGTGVGGAAIVDGRLLHGHLGRAGHLGHLSLNPDGTKDITGTPGSLEDAIGNCTIALRSNGRFTMTKDLIEAAQTGDREARQIWLKSVKALAAAVASFINILDCEMVVIGGGISCVGKDLFEPLAELLNEFEWRPGGNRAAIAPAQLGEYAGALGAAHAALHGTTVLR